MLKKSIIFIIITLITLNSVYSISLFPEEEGNIYSSFKLNNILYDEYTIQVYLESLTTKSIDGFQITIKNKDSSNTITIYNQLVPYSTKQYSFKINQLNPKSLEIRSITNNNHKLVFSSPIQYTFTGNEQQIQEQQPSITTIQQQEPQQLVNEPQYISYTSISKLDNNKDIVYFTKDHISSNRITTNQQGVIEYQANYQPYGNIFTQEGNEKYKFSGKELDSSNLYYFGARYYNPTIGRFTQVDPIYKAEESPYMYANNNPIKYVDPTGKQTANNREASTPPPIVANGLHLEHLDPHWYLPMIEEVSPLIGAENALDWAAIQIAETGGVRTPGHEQAGAIVSYPNPGWDRNSGRASATGARGAAGLSLGDAYPGNGNIYYPPWETGEGFTFTQTALGMMGADSPEFTQRLATMNVIYATLHREYINGLRPTDTWQTVEEANNPESPLNQLSFLHFANVYNLNVRPSMARNPNNPARAFGVINPRGRVTVNGRTFTYGQRVATIRDSLATNPRIQNWLGPAIENARTQSQDTPGLDRESR